jgi:hypothetical protein
MSIKVIDNFLDRKDFEHLKSTMLGTYFPWFFNEMKTDFLDSKFNFQFTHLFYDNLKPNSPHFDLLHPLIHRLNPAALIRIKANLTPVTHEKIVYDYHVDYTDIKCKTAIFYLNSNNGKTLFKDGTEIDSIENRLVFFDAACVHTGTSCTDEKVRCVINLNYFGYV